MTLEELLHSDKDVFTPAEIAPVLRSTDQTIRVVARQRADLLGFPTIIMGTRVRIPRIPWGYSYADTFDAGTVRKYAAGEFPENERWYSARLEPKRLEDPAKIARVLGCSADYLLGLTEELTPTTASPPPGPEPEPESVSQSAVSPLAQANLNRLHGLLLREEQAGSEAAGALRWAIGALEQMLDVSNLDTFAEGGQQKS